MLFQSSQASKIQMMRIKFDLRKNDNAKIDEDKKKKTKDENQGNVCFAVRHVSKGISSSSSLYETHDLGKVSREFEGQYNTQNVQI
ncbi:hypothetical protein TNCV_1513551 [Trichonephila clavipes]|nr:hypothetical protein TNCV_1513551 [Trichonephila clavipes]